MNPTYALIALRYELTSVRGLDSYVLIGSIVMWLRGIRSGVGDVDVFTDREIYDRLKAREGWCERFPDPGNPPLLERRRDGLCIHVWYDFFDTHFPGDIHRQAFESAECVRGWNCQSLALIREWKSLVVRPKDVADVALIDRFMQVAEHGG